MRNNNKVNINQETRFFLRRNRNNFLFMMLAVSMVFLTLWFNQDGYKVNNEPIANNYQNDKILKVSDQWQFCRLKIDQLGTGNYTWAEAVLEDWCSGNGLINDPYVIENVTILGSDENLDGLEIRNSDVYFLIKDCNIWAPKGISLSNVKHGILYKNNVDNGIFLWESSNNYIIENALKGKMRIWDSNFNWIDGNSISRSDGVYIHNSNNNVIKKNTIFLHNTTGLKLEYCHNITIQDNEICDNVEKGIDIVSACNNITIQDNEICENGKYGIMFYDSGNSTIKNNIISNNNRYGIYSDGNWYNNAATNITIYNNTISNHQFGICFSETDYSNISNNKIEESWNGIYLSPGSDYNTITQNTIYFINYCIGDNGNGNNIYSNTCIFIGTDNSFFIIIIIIGSVVGIITVIAVATVKKKK